MPKSDRTFRALARAQPDVVAAMLHLLAPELAPRSVRLTPEDLSPTHIDALPAELDADWAARTDADDLLHIECQGYRDDGFSERLVWYHVGFALRNRGKRRVRTIALWLVSPKSEQERTLVTAGDISVRITTIVLPDVPAELLLSNPRTACFAAGANAGTWSAAELCQRVARTLAQHDPTWIEKHMTVVAAAMQNRYTEMVSAMDQANLEPVILEDLVKFGEDRGFDRGFDRGVDRGRNEAICRLVSRRLGRPLAENEQQLIGQRLKALGEDRVDDIILSLDARGVEAWLADPNAS